MNIPKTKASFALRFTQLIPQDPSHFSSYTSTPRKAPCGTLKCLSNVYHQQETTQKLSGNSYGLDHHLPACTKEKPLTPSIDSLPDSFPQGPKNLLLRSPQCRRYTQVLVMFLHFLDIEIWLSLLTLAPRLKVIDDLSKLINWPVTAAYKSRSPFNLTAPPPLLYWKEECHPQSITR